MKQWFARVPQKRSKAVKGHWPGVTGRMGSHCGKSMIPSRKLKNWGLALKKRNPDMVVAEMRVVTASQPDGIVVERELEREEQRRVE
jgi:hypothetical protein